MKKWILLLCLLALAVTLSACGCKHENQHVDGVVNASCTEDGFTGNMVCGDCNEIVIAGAAIPAYGHAESEILYAKDGTCTYPGYSGDVYCLRCLALVKQGEETPKGDHVPGKDYSYEPTCDSSGRISELHCEDCGILLREAADIPELGHVIPDAEGAYPPTCMAFGQTGSGYCSVCSYYVDTEKIARLPHNFVDNCCTDCGNYKAGLYNADMTEMTHTWEELVEMKAFNDETSFSTIYSISDALEGVLVVEDGFHIDLNKYTFFNRGYELNLSGIHTPTSATAFYDAAFKGAVLDTLKVCGAAEELSTEFLAESQIGELILPETLKTIGVHAFRGIADEEFVLPDSVEVIGGSAFGSCANLQHFTTPKNLREIGDYAFYRCAALEEVVLEGALEHVGSGIFAECTALNSVTISETFRGIGDRMFLGCTALTEIELPEGLTTIFEYAFSESGIAELVLPSTMKKLGRLSEMPEVEFVDMSECELITEWDGMTGCPKLSEIILPPNIVTLGDIFTGNTQLTRVVLPDTVEMLYFNWVSNTALEEIVWPVSLTDGSVLSDAENLTSILYRGTEEQWNATASKDMFPNASVLFDYTGY